MQPKMDFYVYLHRRADDNEVFYVGKGRGNRSKSKHQRNKWWNNIVAKCGGFNVEYVEKGLSEQDAFDLEVETIKFYRENKHPLTNLTDGGEGASGNVFSEETKRRIGENTRKWFDEVKGRDAVICSNGMTFESIYSAGDWLKEIAPSLRPDAAIYMCCRGKTKSCGGFKWRFIKDGVIDESRHDEPIHSPVEVKRGMGVLCSNGLSFKCVNDAVLWLNNGVFKSWMVSHICRCCNGLAGTAYGFRWSYT